MSLSHPVHQRRHKRRRRRAHANRHVRDPDRTRLLGDAAGHVLQRWDIAGRRGWIFCRILAIW